MLSGRIVLTHPAIFPPILDQVNTRTLLRVKKRGGGRWLYFVPGLVIKFATTEEERAALLNEGTRADAAKGAQFWAGDVIGNRMLTRSILVTTRHSNATPSDLHLLAGFVDAKLESAADYPMRPALGYLDGGRFYGTASEGRRRMIAERLDGQRLPQTSMHGDFHFMNLVRSGPRVGVIDWEFFDPEGTFVFDYLDFHFHLEGGGKDNESFLMGLEPQHPAVGRVAAVTGIDPRALILCYGIHELSKKVARLGGHDAIPAATQVRMEQVVERLLAL